MKKSILLLLLSFLAFSPAFTQRFPEKNIKKHIGFLASDKLKGRGTGSKEEFKAAKYIAKQFKKAGLQPKGDNNTYFHQFGFKKSTDPHGILNENSPQVYSNNVAGFIDNGAPYTIVVGAHYDHLGLGFDHNSLDPNPEGKIHNGADDNASGTAGVIELARYFAENGVKERHNFLFLCFSGEELGLVGSKRWCEFPTVPLESITCMLNMDMIGRVGAENVLAVGGVGTAPDFVPLIDNTPTDFKIKKDSAGIGPSDHTSFFLKNIPVLFFWTGQHSDYHKPSDDADKINYVGESRLLHYVSRIIDGIDAAPDAKLKFQEVKGTKKEDTPAFKVTLGIMPDYIYEGEGLRVDGVTDGKPAAKAGVQKGDIIVGLGTFDVKNIQDYMKALAAHKKGDVVPLKVKRGAETKQLEAQF